MFRPYMTPIQVSHPSSGEDWVPPDSFPENHYSDGSLKRLS